MKVKLLVAQSRLTLCDPMDCSPPGSSVQGILQGIPEVRANLIFSEYRLGWESSSFECELLEKRFHLDLDGLQRTECP